ncbi:variable surface protein [Plasmodium gonderi]|uniref:Variable surface protein n=1 Tax=Plasmodium gonderi TaxID=77519 RepID=A0A1Y1JNF5_PLAGO|nr:variable surface protein [Plasmodium gonderi]GAW84126.1 variable surface protein [Plasmodium gonderi]
MHINNIHFFKIIENCLIESTTNELLEKWNDRQNSFNYISYCLILRKINNKENETMDICKRLLKNLNNLAYNGYEEYYLFARCKLLNYWFHYEVNNISNSESADDVKKTVEAIYKVWTDYNKNHIYTDEKRKCKPEYTILSFKDIEDGNKIHECCLNHYTNNIKYVIDDDCTSYYDNIKNKWPQYGASESLFSEEDNEKCRIYYDKCRTYNAKLDFLNVHCLKGVMKAKKFSNTKSQYHTQHSEEHPSGVPGQVQVEGEIYGNDTSPITSQRSHPIGLSLGFSFLGAILFSTVLYKFTPLKFALNKFITNYKNSRNNVDNETFREFLEYTYDSGNNNKQNEQKYIAYHSI